MYHTTKAQGAVDVYLHAVDGGKWSASCPRLYRILGGTHSWTALLENRKIPCSCQQSNQFLGHSAHRLITTLPELKMRDMYSQGI